MKKGILFLTFFIFTVFWTSSDLFGQGNCDRSTIANAERDYKLGKFVETLAILDRCLDSGEFTDDLKEEAYHIKALTHLALDSIQEATNAVVELLRIYQTFKPSSDDPPSFHDMVDRVKLGFDVQVTSVSKKPENIKETPATVMVITANDIKQRGYIDLEAMFSDLPGFDISRTFGVTYSNIYQRGYRSNNTDRTLFMIDGVEENDLWSNIAYMSRQFPISNIKRVEIVYGPASTMYGANAFVGVINVITKNPDDFMSNNKHHLSGEVAVGNFDSKYAELTFAVRKSIFSFTATGRVFSSKEIDLSGYEEYDYNPSDYDTVKYASILKVSEKDKFFGDSTLISSSSYYNIVGDSAFLTPEGEEAARILDKKFATTPGPNNSPIQYSNISDHYFVSSKLHVGRFSLAYQFWKSKSGTLNYATDNTGGGSDIGGMWSPSQSFITAVYSQDINDKVSLTNIAQYKIHQVSDITRTANIRNYSNGNLNALDLVVDKVPFWNTVYFYQLSRQFRNELKINYQPFRGLDIVSGFEVRNGSIYGNYRKQTIDGISSEVDTLNVIEYGSSSLDTVPGGNNFAVYDYGLYFQGSYDLHPIATLTVGGRYDYNKVRASGGYGGIFNPRLALVVTPGDMIFKLIYAKAFKDPANFQKYATTETRLFNNPNLKPERVDNIETSVGYKLSKRLFIDATMYYSEYSGAISAKVVTIDGVSSTRNENEGLLKIFGIQASLNYKLLNYSIYGNYTFVNPKIEQIDKDGEGTGVLIRVGDIASHRINLGLNALFFDRLNINLRGNYASRRPVGEGTSVEDNVLGDFPSFFLLNGAITYKNLLPGLNLQLSVNNILDQEYSDPGIRSADGKKRPYRIPQRGIFTMFKLQYGL